MNKIIFKPGTYKRTEQVRNKLRLALLVRRFNGEKFGFQLNNIPYNKSEGSNIIKKCIDCGKTIDKKSIRCSSCCGIYQSGENHPNWRNGISSILQRIRQSKRYKDWRNKVFTRDNWTCILCGSKNGKGKAIILNADHIIPISENINLMFDVDNGRTLCYDCHKSTDTYGYKQYNKLRSCNE